MKEKEAVEAKILKKGNEPLFGWLQSMQFKLEMIQLAEKGLKEIEDKEKKTEDRRFKLMKGTLIHKLVAKERLSLEQM